MRHVRIPLPPRQIMLPLVLVVALELTACSSGSSDKTTATSASQSQTTAITTIASTTTSPTTTVSTTTSEATSAPTSVAANTSGSSGGGVTSNADLQQVADAWSKATSYKITLNVYDADATTPSFVSTVETMKPDKEHTMTTFAGQSIESITIGNDTYAKVAGSWQKASALELGNGAPVNGDDVVNDFTTPDTTESIDTKITKKDDETIDGVSMNVFELTDATGSMIKIWVGKNDHLPRKSEISTDTGRIEVIYSDYGKDFGITAPI